jgi:hypothetical protein
MKLGGVALVLVLAAGVPAAASADKSEADKAIDRGLAFLQRNQESDGAWRGGPRQPPNAAVTGLCVMAYLSAGHVPGEGRFGRTVEKGIEWVLKQQRSNGIIATDGGHEIYHHGICTLMLAEAAGMTDQHLGEDLRSKLEKAVEVILKAQRTSTGKSRGGWRYHVDPRIDYPPTDLSVTGWQLMALRAAKNLGCDVPPERIDWAIEYVKSCQDSASGGFCYDIGNRVTLGCTGTGILALELCGKEQHRSPEVLKAGSYLINHFNLPRWGQNHFFYSIYYGSQAAFQLGGNYWSIYRPALVKTLLENQGRTTSAWLGEDAASRMYGANYCTAMAILALTVEYRFLPIYQRDEGPP